MKPLLILCLMLVGCSKEKREIDLSVTNSPPAISNIVITCSIPEMMFGYQYDQAIRKIVREEIQKELYYGVTNITYVGTNYTLVTNVTLYLRTQKINP